MDLELGSGTFHVINKLALLEWHFSSFYPARAAAKSFFSVLHSFFRSYQSFRSVIIPFVAHSVRIFDVHFSATFLFSFFCRYTWVIGW